MPGSRQHHVQAMFARAAWLLMAATHGPGLVDAWRGLIIGGPDQAYLGRCVWLTLAMAFFVLKLADVACLRFRVGLQSWVALGLVVALLHVDLIRPGNDPSAVPDCTALLVTACVIGCLPPVREMWRKVRKGLKRALRPHCATAPSGDTIWLASLRPRCWLLTGHMFNHRGPPG